MQVCLSELKGTDRPQDQKVAICLQAWRDKDKKSLTGQGALFRGAKIKSGAVDLDKRTVSFSFSSRNPVRRMIGGKTFKEVLSHERGAIDTERLKRGVVPLLWNHNWDRQIGRIVEYAVQNGKGVATALFSNNQEGSEALADVRDGIKGAISVGYIPRAMRLLKRGKDDGTDNPELRGSDPDDDLDPDDFDDEDDEDDNDDDEDIETFEVNRWEPIEISLVSIPADMTVGIGRAFTETYEVRILGDEAVQDSEVNLKEAKNIMAEPVTNPTEPAPAPIIEIQTEDIGRMREAELSRMREISAYGVQFRCPDEAQDFIRSGKSVAEFQTYILREKASNVQPVVTVADPTLSVDLHDRRRYSIHRAIRAQWAAMRGEGRFDGLEAEVSAEIARIHNQKPSGFYVPDWFLTRDLTVTAPSTVGPATVPTLIEPSLIPLLRNRTAVIEAGARYMSGLTGNVQMPRQRVASTVSWNTEIAAVTESDLTMDSITLSPNRVGGWCTYSKQLIAQSSLDIESVVRNDMLEVIQIAIDSAAINGTGTNQPRGILQTTANTPGTAGPSYDYSKTAPSVTLGPSGYPTWTQVVSMEGNVEAGNVTFDNTACYVTTPKVKSTWKTLSKADPRATNQFYPLFFWADDNTVNGYRAISTNQIPGDKVIFGKWDELLIGQWAGLDVVVDPYTRATQAEINIVTNMFIDVKYRYASAFCYSSTSGVSGLMVGALEGGEDDTGPRQLHEPAGRGVPEHAGGRKSHVG